MKRHARKRTGKWLPYEEQPETAFFEPNCIDCPANRPPEGFAKKYDAEDEAKRVAEDHALSKGHDVSVWMTVSSSMPFHFDDDDMHEKSPAERTAVEPPPESTVEAAEPEKQPCPECGEKEKLGWTDCPQCGRKLREVLKPIAKTMVMPP